MNVDAIDHYREEFHQNRDSLTADRFSETRKTAMKELEENGFPTRRQENWKYTDIRPVIRTPFSLPEDKQGSVAPDYLDECRPEGLECHELVFINGIYNRDISSTGDLTGGMVLDSLENAGVDYAGLVDRHLARYADTKNNPFVALNTAFLKQGAFIYIPRDLRVEKPVHLLFITSDGAKAQVSYPRILVIMEENSDATIIEQYNGTGENHYFTNSVTEICLLDGSRLEHCKIQQENSDSYHIGNLHVAQHGKSHFLSHSFTLGGSITRNDIHAELRDEGAEILLNGLYIATGSQHMDNHTRVDHLFPRTCSREYYRGVVNDHARAVFNGKVVVHKDAQKTDALQSNANLLLADTAEVDTKPELEIYADDVKCSHGATVGQLDDDMLFYLRSRAIDKKTARNMLTSAFTEEIINRIPFPELHSYIGRQVQQKLPDADHERNKG